MDLVYNIQKTVNNFYIASTDNIENHSATQLFYPDKTFMNGFVEVLPQVFQAVWGNWENNEESTQFILGSTIPAQIYGVSKGANQYSLVLRNNTTFTGVLNDNHFTSINPVSLLHLTVLIGLMAGDLLGYPTIGDEVAENEDLEVINVTIPKLLPSVING